MARRRPVAASHGTVRRASTSTTSTCRRSAWRIATTCRLPHVWEIVAAFVDRPSAAARRWRASSSAAVFTFARGARRVRARRDARARLSAILFVHSRLAERALVPYVVASPDGADRRHRPDRRRRPPCRLAVGTAIAAYLTFFPVTVAALRGLRAADPRAFELMRSYAASRRQLLLAAAPPGGGARTCSPRFQIAATASIIGAIIGELPSGVPDGLGGAILNCKQYYTPARSELWATILTCAARPDLRRPRELAETMLTRGRYRAGGGPRATTGDPPRRARGWSGWTARSSGRGRRQGLRAGHGRRSTALERHRPRRSAAASSSRSSGRRVAASRRSCGSSATSRRRHRARPVNGKPARRARLDRDYGMVFQAPVLMDWRTIEKNVELPLEIMGFRPSERAPTATALLDLVELAGSPGATVAAVGRHAAARRDRPRARPSTRSSC